MITLEPARQDDPQRAAGPTTSARSALELFAAAMAFLIPVAYTPGLEASAWSGRSILLLFVVAVGLPLLVDQASGSRPDAARFALVFLLVGLASALLSHNRTIAVFGLYNQETGLLFMASLAAAWAIGRRIRPDASPLLESALIAGVLVNVAIAVTAPLVSLPPSLATAWYGVAGRSQALAGNPVHLAALAVLGLALIVPRFAGSPLRWAGPVAAIAATVELSGTRLALLVMFAILVWALRRHGRRVAAGAAAFVVLGLALGVAIGPARGASATQRSTLAAEGWRSRPTTWLSARHAIAENPLLGVGPDQFRTATSPYRSTAVALSEGSDSLFTDAHNLFVEYATTTGLLGVAALTLWLITAIRPARGCLVVGALAILAIHMLEPQSVITTPLAFLALGGAAPTDRARPRRPGGRLGWIIPTVCLAGATMAAALFAVGEFDLAQSQLDLRVAPAKQANDLLPAWPRPASLLAQVDVFEGIVSGHNGPLYEQSRAWRLTAVRRDDTDPALWNNLANFDGSQGRYAEAESEFLTALRWNPTSALAMDGLSRLAQINCDPRQAALWHQRSLRVAPTPPSDSPVPLVAPPACAAASGQR